MIRDIRQWIAKRRLMSALAAKHANARTEEEFLAALADYGPMAAENNERKSLKLLDRAMSIGIIPVDLLPLRFGSPLWRQEYGRRYLSAEASTALHRAIYNTRTERSKAWLPWAMAAIGVIGALTGLVNAFRH